MVQIRALEQNVVKIYKTGICITSSSSHAYTKKNIKATTWPSSQLLASKELRLSARDQYLKKKGFPGWGELRSVETKPTKATSLLDAHANDRATVTQTTQFMYTCYPIMEKQCSKYETTLYMPHVSGQPPTNHPMQVPIGESNTESVPTPITQPIVIVIFIYSSLLCLFGQQNFPGSHRGSLSPSDIFRVFIGGYTV